MSDIKKPAMTKEMVMKWKAGYEAVNAITLAEQRAKTGDERLAEIGQLYLFAKNMGWFEKMRSGDASARENWCKLKSKYLEKCENSQ